MSVVCEKPVDCRPIFFYSVFAVKKETGAIHSSAGMTRASDAEDVRYALDSGWLPGWGPRFIWVFPASDAQEPVNTDHSDFRRHSLVDMGDLVSERFQGEGI